MVTKDFLEQRLEPIESRLDSIESRLNGVEVRVNTVESTMLTKKDLDQAVNDMRGENTKLLAMEDSKVATIVDILQEKSIFTETDAKRVLLRQPFPRG